MRIDLNLVVLLLLGMMVSPALAQRPDAPELAQRGAYAVGTRDIRIADETRPLTVTMWYPADVDTNAVTDIEYSALLTLRVPGRAVRDAPPLVTDTPYPLVVFSHGSGGSRVLHLWLTEHLASYGYVVMAADHPGDNVQQTVLGGSDYSMNWAQRPIDVLRQINFADALNTDSDFAGLIDVENVAVIGHSFGGATALLAGGARLDFEKLAAYCENPIEDIRENSCFNAGYQREIADSLGYEDVPSIFDANTDERIKAVVALAPWNEPLLNLEMIDVPTLVAVGSADLITPAVRDANRIYEQLDVPKHLFTFMYGGHYIFVDECAPVLIQFDAFDACSDLVWDMPRVHDLTKQVLVSFLDVHLRGDDSALSKLAAENVDYTGTSYSIEGYSNMD